MRDDELYAFEARRHFETLANDMAFFAS